MRNNKKKGFTLVELLVVIAILAILATVSTVGYTAFVQQARNSNAKTELTQIITLVQTELMSDDEMTFEAGDDTYVITKTDAGLECKKNDEAFANVGEALMAHPEVADLKGKTLTCVPTQDGFKFEFTKEYNGDIGKATITTDANFNIIDMEK